MGYCKTQYATVNTFLWENKYFEFTIHQQKNNKTDWICPLYGK